MDGIEAGRAPRPRQALLLAASVAAVTILALFWGLRAGATSAPGAGSGSGSLVRTTMQSEVAVVLDEIPESMRDRVAAALVQRPAEFWIARAEAQLRLTTYRLVFREAFYNGKKALPLPPEPMWEVVLTGGPRRHAVDGHDVVGVGYRVLERARVRRRVPG